MKIKFCNNNGANCQSLREDTITLEEIGLTERGWKNMAEEEKLKLVEEWMWDKMDLWYEEIE